MSYGYQKTTSNIIDYQRISIDTVGDIVHADELMNYLKLQSDKGLKPFVDAAIETIEKRYNYAIRLATYKYTALYYPLKRQGYNGLSPIPAVRQEYIRLEYAPIISVISVKEDGELTEYENIKNTIFTCASQNIEIIYQSGYTHATLPADIRQAILQLAAYNYEHAGGCSIGDSLKQSGVDETMRRLI